jgi:hypothetical protein
MYIHTCAALAVIAAIGARVSSAPPDTTPPIATTVCELLKEPERFHGRLVRVRAGVHPPGVDEPTMLFDRGCRAAVELVVPPDRNLTEGSDYQLLRSYIAQYGPFRLHIRGKRKGPKTPGRMLIEVTAIGQFEHVLELFGKEYFLLTLTSVSDVTAKPIELDPNEDRSKP